MRTPEDAPTDADQLIRFGAIASVDLAAARCVVKLDDESQSPPIRWFEVRSGKTRTWSPPSVGEQVVLLCPAGEIGAAVALRGLPCDAFPAAGNSLTELTEYEDGAVISYDPVGHALSCVLPSDGTAAIVASGGFIITGPVTIKGDVSIEGTATVSKDVVVGGISFNGHTHGLVKTGTDTSGGPQ